MWNPRVITTDAVQNFLEKGGKLDYRPIHTPKGWNWELWAVQSNGAASPVISSKTGEARVFKSSDALVSFHMRIFPDAEGVWVPAPKSGQDEDSE